MKTLSTDSLKYLLGKLKTKFLLSDNTTTVSTIGIDNTPTQNSDNLVKSGGVYTGLLGKADKVSYDYTQTWTIPNDIAANAKVYCEFAENLKAFVIEITTAETVISASTGYFYISTSKSGNVLTSAGRFWEPAFGQSHASKLFASFYKGDDGLYRVYGYKYGLSNDSDYTIMTTYNIARQNVGRIYFQNPQPLIGLYFDLGTATNMPELAGTTIKVRGIKW